MKILVGSKYFFSSYPDFNPHDTDYVILVDSQPLPVYNIRGHGEDIFVWRRMTKEEWIKETKSPIQVGKFLVPEFCSQIGFELNDLVAFTTQFQALDDKHTYYRIIYSSYCKNNDFTLTPEQRDEAYKEYKKLRQNGLETNNNAYL